MNYTTFFPSITWRFALLSSPILVLIYKFLEHFILFGGFFQSFLISIFCGISHFIIGFTIGAIPYIFFARIGNDLIKKGKTNFEKKLFLLTYAILICFFMWRINFIIFIFEPMISFYVFPFFICLTFAIWYYEIKMEIVPEEAVEGILDDNFIIPRK